MKKSRRVIWVLAIALLLLPTLWIVYVVGLTQLSFISSSKMMLSGTYTLSSPTPAPLLARIDRDTVYNIVALVIIYAPGLALLIFAAFYRRRPHEISPPTI
jgi:hypothetical protein